MRFNRIVWSLSAFGALSVSVFACNDKPADQTESTATRAQRVVQNDAGVWVTGSNCYDGGYNYCNNNCHHAANCGLDAGNDGIISCNGGGNGGLGGHTVNWDEVPCTTLGGIDGACYCASNPQSGANTAACCWQQVAGDSPNVGAGGEGAACAAQVCSTTADGGAGAADSGTPVAFDAGEPWNQTPLDCTAGSATSTACASCCQSNYNTQVQWCSQPGALASCRAQVDAGLASCQQSCNGVAAGNCGAQPTNSSCTQCCINAHGQNTPPSIQCVTGAGCVSKPLNAAVRNE